ncbi:MAG: carbohydrate porin [Emcibacter sp.]|nr:carbohydrate porin [Emcibacter sp.]
MYSGKTLFKKTLFTAITAFSMAPFAIYSSHAQSLSERGVDFGASYVAGYQVAPLGSDAGDSAKQRLTLNMSVDTEKLFGLKNGSFFVQYQNHNGEHAGGNIHDIQQFDGLDDPEYNRIHMLWYQHIFADGKLRIKVGKVEPKSEFFAPENAKNHLGFSTERSPTIIAQGPPSMSFNAFYQATENLSFAVGVYDASWNEGRDENNFKLHNLFEASSVAIFLEARYKWTEGLMGRAGGLKVGFWRLDGTKTKFNGDVVDGTDGLYVVFDQTLTDNGIGIYAQYGVADKDISPVSRHLGVGVQWVGPISGREKDVFGAGISSVKFSNALGATFIEDSETAYEIFYKAHVNEWITVQADIQAINNPGGMGAKDIVVSTLRASLSY